MKANLSRFLGRFMDTAFLILVVWVFVVSTQPVFSQSFGRVLGTVSDPSGAVLPGVTVTLTNTNTGDKRETISGASGSYQILNVLPGTYKIDVEATGFRRFTQQPIEVKTLAAVRIDVPLVIGSLTETVEVTASEVLLETDKSSVETTIDGIEVQQLPVSGRNPMSLAQLVPGVVPQTGAIGTAGFAAAGNFQISGSFGNQSAEYLDGAPLNSPYANTVIFIPPQDAVQEFRVSTNNADIEFGRSSGGAITMTIKSGTNEFHGSAYEYWRNKVLNSPDYFAAKTDNPNPPFNQHQYGATLGGPIKENKAFFFFSWENFTRREGSPFIVNVPTAAYLKGDFSALIPAGTNCDATPTVGCIFDPTTKKAFPENKIPTDRFDSTANYIANVQKIWPLPNASLSTGNYATSISTGLNSTQFNARVDYNHSDKQRLFFRYTDYRSKTRGNDPFGTGIGSEPMINNAYQIAIGDNYVFSPSMVGEIHASYLRKANEARAISNKPETDMGAYGPNWEFMNTAASCKGSPNLAIDSITWGGNSACVNDTENIYSLTGSISKLTHGHTLKFGGELRRIELYFRELNYPVGTYTFATGSTSGGGNSATGVGFASFLLGAMQAGSGQLQNGFTPAGMQFYQAYYVSDTWQVKPRLTLNLGVRWELPGGYSEKKDRETVFLLNSPNPILPQFKGNIALVNSPDWPYRINQIPRHDLFAPRVGFAYRATNSLVFRAGYGITFPAADTSMGLAPWNSAINAANTTPYGPSFSNPFPNGIIQAPGRDPSYQFAFLGQNFLFPSPGVFPNEVYPYVQQWNFNIQTQLGKSSALQIGYVGSKGTHLPTLMSFNNQLPPEYYNAGPGLLKMVPNPMFGKLPATANPLLTMPVIFQGILWKPIPQYFPWVTTQNESFGSSIYHSLQASFRKQFGEGGLVSVAYTWAKLISDVDTATPQAEGVYQAPGGGTFGGQDAYNRPAERGLTLYDVPHRLVFSYALDLPFGKGKKFLGGAEGIANMLVSGWGVNGITTFQSGMPLVIQVEQPTLNGLPLDLFMGVSSLFGLRPNIVPGCNKEIEGDVSDRLDEYFNTACFTQPAVIGFGDAFGDQPMTDPQLRSHGIINFDFSVFKTFPVTERVGFEFRAEAFNIFNRVRFGPPGGKLNPATLGTAGDRFGKITVQSNDPRQIQLALRLKF
jgi:hypothetical protein